MQNKNLVILLVILILIIVGAVAVYFIFPEFGSKVARVVDIRPEKPQVVENEKLVILQTEKITGLEAKVASEVTEATIQTSLVPKNEAEKIIVPKAVLTVKSSYNLAKSEAEKWANDAVPIFIKSLGAVTLDGKSSQWQLAFSSKTNTKKGYEIIIQGDSIVSKKEIELTTVGAAFPENLKDSDSAIVSLQELPQFSDATVSAINLSYNTDGSAWFYVLTTSRGLTSIKAQ